jgi:hypothetical protein
MRKPLQDPRRIISDALEAYAIGLGLDPTLIRPFGAAEAVVAALRAVGHLEPLGWLSTSHRALETCPGCGKAGLSTVALTKLAYTYETCGCSTPEIDHLVEQLWHRRCFRSNTEFEAAAAEVARLQAKLKDYEQLFDLQWSRSQQADALWRAEAPADRANVMPDLGDLLEWLIERGDSSARRGYDQAIAVLRGGHERSGSPAAKWAADYLAADPDREAPARAKQVAEVDAEDGDGRG